MRKLHALCTSFEHHYRGGILKLFPSKLTGKLYSDLCNFLWCMAAIEASGYADKAATSWYQELRALPPVGDRQFLFNAFTDAPFTEAYLKADSLARTAYRGTYLDRRNGRMSHTADPHLEWWECMLQFSVGDRVVGDWKRLSMPLTPLDRDLSSMADEARWFIEANAMLDQQVMEVCQDYAQKTVPQLRSQDMEQREWLDAYASALIARATEEERKIIDAHLPQLEGAFQRALSQANER